MNTVAFSPCPNDTYIFYAWAAGLVGGFPIQTHLEDVETLNAHATKGSFPITKLSISTFGNLLDDYILLPYGAALGDGIGPKIIAKTSFPLSELHKKSIAIPGKQTTANLLLELLTSEPKEKKCVYYHEVMNLVKRGEVDCGLIIHESRLTFMNHGLKEIADLGELWQKRFSLPLPLGGIAAKRSLGDARLLEAAKSLKESIAWADANSELTRSYILQHSIEKEWSLIKKYINLYVNQETRQLSSIGKQSIETLLSVGYQQGLLPYAPSNWLLQA